jgi:pimeloyl-ACP methyl ester carboxylesterase
MDFFILLSMIFCHILDDFKLQGIMAEMKQRSYWDNHIDIVSEGNLWRRDKFKKKYGLDFMPVLFLHGFSNSFMMMLPIAVYMFYKNYSYWPEFALVLFANSFIHAWIDHLKCNKKVINLMTDQRLHLTQIFLTWFLFIVIL